MNKAEKNKTWIIISLLVVSLLYYLWMAAQIPYCHDDWDWGLPVGVQQLITANLNSRYVGNLIEVILTRSTILKTVVMGSVTAFLPFITSYTVCEITSASENRREMMIPLVFLSNVLMLSVPLDIWRQTFGWVAGFSNFVMSSFALVLYQRLIGCLLVKNTKSFEGGLFCFLFGLIVQLFLENVTVYVMAISSICLAHTLFGKQVSKARKMVFALWLGNLIGTGIMFSSGMYRTLIETGTAIDGYRTLTFELGENPFSVLFHFLRRFIILYPVRIWLNNTFLCCAVLLLLTILLLQKKCGNKKYLWICVNLILFCYVLYCFEKGTIWLISDWWTNVFSAGMGLLFFFVVLIEATLVLQNSGVKKRAFLYCWLSGPLVILPMVVISSVGARSFLTSYLFMLETCLLLTVAILENVGKRTHTIWNSSFALVLCSLWLVYGSVYYSIGIVNTDRTHEIEDARSGRTNQILLKSYPYSKYLWGSDPEYGSERVFFFRSFYRIPDDVEIWFESWKD